MPLTKKDLIEALQEFRKTDLKAALKEAFNEFKKTDLKEAFNEFMKTDLKEAFSEFGKEQDKNIERRLQELDDKIAVRLVKHFYTKDEIDSKFKNVDNKLKKLDGSVMRLQIEFESFRHDSKAQAEGIRQLYTRTDDHAKRIQKLEERP